MKYVWGPVKSRRLGFSLGISLTPYKICSFDCIYCQLGRTTEITSERKEYLSLDEVLDELNRWFKNNPADAGILNYVTISGSGEPTLNLRIGEFISRIKQLTKVPVAVITNASLLQEPAVRQGLLGADLILPSLDAVTLRVFERIDRPHKGINVEKIIDGLVELRREFKGSFWLEVMLVKGVNDDLRHIRKLKDAIDRINPDKIHLNSPVRSPAEAGIAAVDGRKLGKIKEMLGEKCEII